MLDLIKGGRYYFISGPFLPYLITRLPSSLFLPAQEKRNATNNEQLAAGDSLNHAASLVQRRNRFILLLSPFCFQILISYLPLQRQCYLAAGPFESSASSCLHRHQLPVLASRKTTTSFASVSLVPVLALELYYLFEKISFGKI